MIGGCAERSGVNRFHRYYCASPRWARLVQTALVPAVLEGTELDRRVLELGPGPGLTTEVLAGVARSGMTEAAAIAGLGCTAPTAHRPR